MRTLGTDRLLALLLAMLLLVVPGAAAANPSTAPGDAKALSLFVRHWLRPALRQTTYAETMSEQDRRLHSTVDKEKNATTVARLPPAIVSGQASGPVSNTKEGQHECRAFFCRHCDRHSPVALCSWQLGREANDSDAGANTAEGTAERVRVTVPSTWPSPVLECKRGKSEYSEPLSSTTTVNSQVIDNLSRANCIMARSMDARRIEHDEINTAVPGADNNTLHAEYGEVLDRVRLAPWFG